MEYSALLFGKNESIDLFLEDKDCLQIVQCLNADEMKDSKPEKKVMFVRMSDKLYVALLIGLKAVSQENVLVIKEKMEVTLLQKIKKELSEYPAIYYNENIQAFDTRLVMFCLQVAIESNFAIDSYSKAVEILGSTPLKKI